jgi:pimeloyl-[acyl-carrier protein] methyl ester esterase
MLFGQGMHSLVEIIAYHGWGFDQTFWDPWSIIFSKYNYLFNRFDRGYFGDPQDPRFRHHESKKVVMVHSYGLHLCPREQLEAADLIIIFNSFIHFHPMNYPAQRLSYRNHKKMLDKLLASPEVVLHDFYSRCCSENLEIKLPCAINLNIDLLFQDLQRLGIEFFNLDPIKRHQEKIIFHSSLDPIVPLSQGQDLFDHMCEGSTFWVIPTADHSLPLTKTKQCRDLVELKILTLLQQA